MQDLINLVANISTLAFVVSSMLAMGLSLTVAQIVEPLRNVRLVALALLANFVLAPLVAVVLKALIPLSEPLGIGLILMATAAGAPFLPKLAQAARGNIALSVGLMVVLMVVTVVYVPLVLPLLLPGVSVNPLDIASSLVVLMLIPLGIGLFIRARYADTAASLQPVFAQVSNTAFMLLAATMLLLNWRTLLQAIGSGAIIATLLFVVIMFALGFMLGGRDPGTRSVLGLGTAQRNISAALVIAAQNFGDPNVLTEILVGSVLMLVILMPLGGELGKRTAAAAEAAEPSAQPMQ
jgi:BASS family bile acid:Na+ symporter